MVSRRWEHRSEDQEVLTNSRRVGPPGQLTVDEAPLNRPQLGIRACAGNRCLGIASGAPYPYPYPYGSRTARHAMARTLDA